VKIIKLVITVIFLTLLLFSFNGCSSAGQITAGISVSSVDNVTTGAITIDNTGAYDFMVAIENAMADLASALKFLAGAIFVIGILVLALWKEKMTLYFTASIVTFTMGLTWAEDYDGVTLALMILTVYLGLQGMILALDLYSQDKGGGWSRFRGIYNKVKDIF